MKTRLTAVSIGPGIADIIAHIPAQSGPSSSRAGYRARVALAERQEGSGRWKAVLYAKAYPLHEEVAAVPDSCGTEFSVAERGSGYTLRSLVTVLQDRDEWWTA